MNRTYLIRAKLGGSLDSLLTDPPQLPIKFGQFQLDRSPNYKQFLYDQGVFEPDPGECLPREDRTYPVSLLYLDFEMSEMDVGNGQQLQQDADETLAQLQALMRLFQAGDVWLRRHTMRDLQEQKTRGSAPTLEDLLYPCTEPEPSPSYERSEYKLDDETLARFIEFFDSYWEILEKKRKEKKPESLYLAMCRFSSSYEKRTLADRLLDLMIAMEALFGDQGESTYKISLRSACLLYKPGEAREGAFKTIKDLYNQRSRIVHGDTSKLDNKNIELFEEYVRNSIIRLLELSRRKVLLSSTKELDHFLFFKQHDDL